MGVLKQGLNGLVKDRKLPVSLKLDNVLAMK